MNIRQVITSDLEKAVKILGIEISKPIHVGHPTDPNFGDYATSWPMQVSAELSTDPTDLAKRIIESLPNSEVYGRAELAGVGFINFRLKEEFLAKHLKLVLAEGDKFGASTDYKGQRVLVEFSSPNIAKPMHVGHLRNTNLGQALVNILGFVGYETITDNHIGDWGTQFGEVLTAYKNWGRQIKNPNVSDLLDLYIKFHQEVENHPDLAEAAKDEFKKLESGDRENRALWKIFRDNSLAELHRLYRELEVRFDHEFGESFYEADLPKIIDWALKSGVAKKDSDNSVLIELENMPPFLIQKSDGATLYGTRDLATAKYRVEKFHPSKVVYVVGAEQSLYFKQLFLSLRKLGWGQETEWVHISYGLTRLPEGRMSTRRGELVTVQEILEQAKAEAAKVLQEKSSGADDKKLVSDIAVGAIKWNDLKVSRESEVIFDWERVFSLDGNTGPYMQYSYARTENILAKVKPVEKMADFDPRLLSHPMEQALMRQLVLFPEIVSESAKYYAPHLISSYSYELAHNFSRFYEEVPVLANEPALKQARLGLVRAVGQVLRSSLHLLGITTPSRL